MKVKDEPRTEFTPEPTLNKTFATPAPWLPSSQSGSCTGVAASSPDISPPPLDLTLSLRSYIEKRGIVKPIPQTLLPSNNEERKKVPVSSGVLDYFASALIEVAKVSYRGNEQHNPGEPLHWARGKSMNQEDALLHHYLERGTLDTDGARHSAKMAWRALALLQLELEAAGAPIARGAR